MFLGRNPARRVAAVLAIGGLAGELPAQATEQFQVSPTLGTGTQRFGATLSLDGDRMAVGAPYDDTTLNDGGAVDTYVWDATTGSWQFEQQVLPSDAEIGGRFGLAVALKGDLLLVGSPYHDTARGTDAGQAYVFRFDSGTNTWKEEQKLVPASGGTNDHFGSAVAVGGNLAICGAPLADPAIGTDAGCAFAFRYKNSFLKWVEEKQLLDPDGAAGDFAGSCVALDGSMTIVGSPGSAESSKFGAGSVGVWTVSGTTWSQGQELTLATPQYYGAFGTAVRFSGDALLVTSPSEDESPSILDSGAVHLFRLSGGTFTEERRFASPTPTSFDYFGTDAAIDGDLLVVGAQSVDVGKPDCGAAYLYRYGRRPGWVFDQQLGASDDTASDHFGAQVAITGEHVLVTADGNDTTPGYDWGVLYGFDRRETVLTITPSNPAPDQAITFSAFRGDPGDVVMITIEDVSGTHFFIPLLVYVFASDHTLTFTSNAPNPAYGVHVGMRAYKISPLGPLVFSDLAYVDV